MKQYKLILIAIFSSTISFAQNSNPYAVFGHTSNVVYKMPVNEMLYIKNKDTNSEIKAMAFDIENNQIKLLGKNDSLLSVESLKGNKLLRWLSLDPKSQKYVGFSPYNFVLNNPIRNFDPNGQEVWINYGDNQKVRYENGNLFNANGSAYKGNDPFVSTVTTNLNSINSVKNGNTVVSGLVNSSEVFTFVNSAVPNSGGKASMGFMPGAKENGGTIYAQFLTSNASDASKVDGTSNELFNAYQQVSGEKGNNLNKEVASYLFSFGVTQSLYPEYNPQLGNNNTANGQKFNQNMETLLTSETYDPKLYSQTVKLFPKSGGIGQAYSDKGVPTKANVKNPTISTFFPLIEKK